MTEAQSQLDTPVTLLIFNRPDTTARVFEAVRRARPRRLLVVADGPRQDRPGEADLTAAARGVVKSVDWDCELSVNYSEVNLGCKRRVSSGLSWVFDTVDEAIVLEDDCLPHSSFFRFCEELLARYRGEDRVMHISGDNFESVGRPEGALTRLSRRLRPWRRKGPSYYLSRYPHVWGWASWRRAWESYDLEISAWTLADDKGTYLDQFSDPSERAFWRKTWDEVAAGETDTWDYQWAFACLSRRGLSVMPRTNLVSNIGFGEGSTHTGEGSPLADLPTGDPGFPLRHPPSLARDADADRHAARLFFGAGE